MAGLEDFEMHRLLLGIVAILSLVSPAQSTESRWYYLGSEVTYGNLVDNPDYRIRIVALKSGQITLALVARDVKGNLPPQIELTRNEPVNVYVKGECTNVCRSFFVILKWTSTLGEDDTSVRIEYDVKVIPGRSS